MFSFFFNTIFFIFCFVISEELKLKIMNYYRLININVGFAELKGKQLNTLFLLAPFWLKANIKNDTIYSLKLYT
jgi:hypothetical protein